MGINTKSHLQTNALPNDAALSIGPIGPLADIARSLPLDEECHRNAWQVPFRVRHQKEAIDGVVLRIYSSVAEDESHVRLVTALVGFRANADLECGSS